MFDLHGKTALITGGGSGLGRAIAHGFADMGARIIVVGRHIEPLLATIDKRDGMALSYDVMQQESLMMLHDELYECGYMPDIIVNGAGVNLRQSAADITSDSWDQTLHLNLKAPFFLSRLFVKHMREQGFGRIINIASLQSSRAFTNGLAYGASKGGITQLTRAMAQEWSGYNITVNALAPGFFPTPLTQPLFDDADKAQELAGKTAMQRNGTLDDIKGPAIFLASSASNYVTGQVLHVDGGFTAL